MGNIVLTLAASLAASIVTGGNGPDQATACHPTNVPSIVYCGEGMPAAPLALNREGYVCDGPLGCIPLPPRRPEGR